MMRRREWNIPNLTCSLDRSGLADKGLEFRSGPYNCWVWSFFFLFGGRAMSELLLVPCLSLRMSYCLSVGLKGGNGKEKALPISFRKLPVHTYIVYTLFCEMNYQVWNGDYRNKKKFSRFHCFNKFMRRL